MKKIILAIIFTLGLIVFPLQSVEKDYQLEIDFFYSLAGIYIPTVKAKVIRSFNDQIFVSKTEAKISFPVDLFLGISSAEIEHQIENSYIKKIGAKYFQGDKLKDSYLLEIDTQTESGQYNNGQVISFPFQTKDLINELMTFTQEVIDGQGKNFYQFLFFHEWTQEIIEVKVLSCNFKENKISLDLEFSSDKNWPGINKNSKGIIEVDLIKKRPKKVKIGQLVIKFK